jgi:hypothetical protein
MISQDFISKLKQQLAIGLSQQILQSPWGFAPHRPGPITPSGHLLGVWRNGFKHYQALRILDAESFSRKQ